MDSKHQFTDTQKAAIVSLIIEMINADHEITLEELRESNIINAELGITEEIFCMGRALDVEYAMAIVRRFSDEEKLQVGMLLVRIIDADDDVADDEIRLLNRICRQTGIDIALRNVQLKDD